MFSEESQTKRLFMNSSHEIRKKKESLNLCKRSLYFGLDADLGKQDEKIMFLIPFFFWKDLNELARDWADEKKLVFDAEIFLSTSTRALGPIWNWQIRGRPGHFKAKKFCGRGLTGRFSGQREIEQVFEVKWDRKHLLHPHRANL